jgi:pyrrolysyl-tRNA synthetase-like protein
MASKRNAAKRGTDLAIYKRPYLFDLVDKMKLWPSKSGILHGVRQTENLGGLIRISTHCGAVIVVRSSRRSRASRWLRNRWMRTACSACGVPEWKTERFKRSVS